MKYNHKTTIALMAVLLGGSAGVQAAPAAADDPFAYFNVYSLGDIGSSTDYYKADFQGIAGMAGDGYFGNALDGNPGGGFGFHNTAGSDNIAHVGGDFTLRHGSATGNLDVAGNVTIKNAYWGGDISAGGDVTHNPDYVAWGTIGGATNVAGGYGGNIGSDGYSFVGGLNTGVAYDGLFDFSALNEYFSQTSLQLGSAAVTGVVETHVGDANRLILNAVSGDNVFTLTESQLNAAHTVDIVGPSDAKVFINVGGENVSLDGTTWNYLGGVTAGGVILNYSEAADLRIVDDAANSVNILAPFADVLFNSGLVTGNLITGNLLGGGQVNLARYTAGYVPSTPTAPVPTPAPILLMGLGLIGIMATRRALRLV